MKEIILFTGYKELVTNKSLLKALQIIKSDETDILYIHTALNFGMPNNSIPKKDLLYFLLEAIRKLNVSTLIFPTYTFSFCNGKNFNVQGTKSPMGLLNNYVLAQEDAIRSSDPLMSNVLLGKHKEFVEKIGKKSIGEKSTFDLFYKTNLKVKFLFLGPLIGDCFTYMHYIEERLNVPYRYKRSFSGCITNHGVEYDDTYELFVRYSNVQPGTGSFIYENILLERKEAKRINVGNSIISITDLKSSDETYVELISRYPNFFIKEPFDETGKTNEFIVNNMISL